MAVNLTALHLPFPVKHWVSFHHEFFETAVPFLKYLQQRIYQTNPFPITHSSDEGINVDKVWKFKYHDKSGWFATKIASELGYQSIVLCGIPMDNQPKFYEDKMTNCKLKDYLWEDLPQERIRSLSGNTKKYFGDYLNG